MSEGLPDIYLRFAGIAAECTDELHPGPEADAVDGKWGWFQFKSFSFNFNVNETGAADPAGAAASGNQGAARPAAARGNRPAPPAAGAHGAAAQDSGPHSHPDITVSKSLDSASALIWQNKCYEGQEIEQVELEACRTGGIPGAGKIPFVRFIFEGVYVKSITMTISEDSLPSESLVFSYERVKMESIWTDNDTGERCNAKPRHFGWDFKNNKQWMES